MRAQGGQQAVQAALLEIVATGARPCLEGGLVLAEEGLGHVPEVFLGKCALRRYVNLEAQAIARQGRNPRSAPHNGARPDCG